MKMYHRKKLPYQGIFVHDMPKEVCFTCQHYGCTDFVETSCPGYEKASRLTVFFRRLSKKIFQD